MGGAVLHAGNGALNNRLRDAAKFRNSALRSSHDIFCTSMQFMVLFCGQNSTEWCYCFKVKVAEYKHKASRKLAWSWFLFCFQVAPSSFPFKYSLVPLCQYWSPPGPTKKRGLPGMIILIQHWIMGCAPDLPGMKSRRQLSSLYRERFWQRWLWRWSLHGTVFFWSPVNAFEFSQLKDRKKLNLT